MYENIGPDMFSIGPCISGTKEYRRISRTRQDWPTLACSGPLWPAHPMARSLWPARPMARSLYGPPQGARSQPASQPARSQGASQPARERRGDSTYSSVRMKNECFISDYLTCTISPFIDSPTTTPFCLLIVVQW